MLEEDYLPKKEVEGIEEDSDVCLANKGQDRKMEAVDVEAQQVARLEQERCHKDNHYGCFEAD